MPADATGGGAGPTEPSTGGDPAPTTSGDPSAATDDGSSAMTADGSTAASSTTADPTTAPDDAPPDAPALQLQFSQIKQFDFTWPAVAGADYYKLFERVDADAEDVALGNGIFGTSVSKTMPLHLRVGASYSLSACNKVGCTASESVVVVDSLVDAIGYFKASNPGFADAFGVRVALSGDGLTMAVAATAEDGEDDSVESAGAVYIFVRDANDDDWTEQTVLRAPSPGEGDYFGFALALSEQGDTLAVGVPSDDSAATGIDGDDTDNTAKDAGAVHVFTRSRGSWKAQAYVKAANAGASDLFGSSLALSDAGDVLAVGAIQEDDLDDMVADAGAVYVFTRVKFAWSETDYVKPTVRDPGDKFGSSVALAGDGRTLVVGAKGEASGMSKAPDDNTSVGAGAVYVYAFDDGDWGDEFYLKAKEPGMNDSFGSSVALSGDGKTLVVGAALDDGPGDVATDCGAAHVFERQIANVWSPGQPLWASNSEASMLFGGSVALSDDGAVLAVGAVQERSGAAGVDGQQKDTSLKSSGAVYVFERTAPGWAPPRYVKAANPGKDDRFSALALSSDGRTLAVGAHAEDGNAAGIGGDQRDEAPEFNAGAVYLY